MLRNAKLVPLWFRSSYQRCSKGLRTSESGHQVRTAMATVGFIGLGNMGLPMAQNLVKSGHAVSGFDLSEYATERLAVGGGKRATSMLDACKDAEIVITMLPAGEQVREVYL